MKERRRKAIEIKIYQKNMVIVLAVDNLNFQ
jgi:hypothetical protein